MAVVKDDVDEEYDDALATFVINSHMKNHPNVRAKFEQAENEGLEDEQYKNRVLELNAEMEAELLPNNRMEQNTNKAGLIPQDLLKKYLIYCKRNIQPRLSEIDQNKVTQFYADIRRESNIAGGIPIAVRHIESVIRMSEAYAKIN